VSADRAHPPPLIKRSDLIQENNRGHHDVALRWLEQHCRGIQQFAELRRDGRHDGDEAVAIGNVILHDERRVPLLDLRAHGGVEGDEGALPPLGPGDLRPPCHASSSTLPQDPLENSWPAAEKITRRALALWQMSPPCHANSCEIHGLPSTGGML